MRIRLIDMRVTFQESANPGSFSELSDGRYPKSACTGVVMRGSTERLWHVFAATPRSRIAGDPILPLTRGPLELKDQWEQRKPNGRG